MPSPGRRGRADFCDFLQRGYLVEGAAPELGPGREHAHSRAGKDALELLRHGGEVGVRAGEHLRAAFPAHLVGDAAEVEVVCLLALGARGEQRLSGGDGAGDEAGDVRATRGEGAQELRDLS